MSEKRQKLIEKCQQIQWVPGHGPDLKNMTDEELEKQAKFADMIEQTFVELFDEEEDENI